MSKKNKDEGTPQEFHASIRDVDEFLKGSVWREIETELKEWLGNIMDELTEETNEQEVFRFQGRAQVLKKVLILPHIMYESAMLESEQRKQDKS